MKNQCKIIHPFIIAIVTFLVFSPSLVGDFLWDDEFLIVHNPMIKSLENLPAAFSSHFFQGSFETGELTYFRPFVTMMNMFQYAIFGLKPFWWHLFNVLIHALNAVLLYFFVRKILNASPVAALTGALFWSVHPALSEAVSFISGRTDILAFTFILAGLILFFRESKIMLFLSAVSFILGLMCKEIVIMFPVVVLMVAWRKKGVRGRDEDSVFWKDSLCRLLPFVIIAGIYFFYRFFLVKGIRVSHYPGESMLSTWMTMPRVFVRYLRLTIFPVGLINDYTRYFTEVRSPLNLRFIFPVIVLAGFISMIFILNKRRNGLAFSVAWFLLFLLPVLNIFPLGLWMAERFLYIPLAGAAIFAAFLMEPLFKKEYERRKISLFAILLILIFGAMSFLRAGIWNDALVLWYDAVNKNPDNPQARIILGQILTSRGRPSEAIEHFKTADTEKSPNLEFHKQQSLANAYLLEEKYEAAEKAMRKAEEILPGSARNSLINGRIAFARGNLHEAVGSFEESLKRNPDLLGALDGLMRIYWMRNAGAGELLPLAEKAIDLNPDYAPGYFYKGGALRKLQRNEEAKTAFQKAARINPGYAPAYLHLAELYESEIGKTPGSFEKAVQTYRDLLENDPDNITALNNLAILLARAGQKQKAEELWKKVLRINPDDQEAKMNLERLNKETTSLKEDITDLYRIYSRTGMIDNPARFFKMLKSRWLCIVEIHTSDAIQKLQMEVMETDKNSSLLKMEDYFSTTTLKSESGMLYSIGPDRNDDSLRIIYDPTNGIFSRGDITLKEM